MKYIFIMMICSSCCGTKTTQTAGTDSSTVVENSAPAQVIAGKPVALYFGSVASGPIGDEFLKTWLLNFKAEEKVELTADKFSGCGKEGEYIIVINKMNFSPDKEEKFTTGLQQLVTDEVKRAKTQSSSAGSVEIRPDPKVEDYSYCRLGSKKWL